MSHNKIVSLIALAGVTLCCSAIALGKDATTDWIDGKWVVTFTVQGQEVSGQMTFQAHGDKLGGTVETKHTGLGTLNGGAIASTKLSGIYVFDQHEAIAIAGEFKQGTLAGVFRTEGFDGKWEAHRADAQP